MINIFPYLKKIIQERVKPNIRIVKTAKLDSVDYPTY